MKLKMRIMIKVKQGIIECGEYRIKMIEMYSSEECVGTLIISKMIQNPLTINKVNMERVSDSASTVYILWKW